MANQDLRSHPLAIVVHLDNLNGLDHSKGSHKNNKLIFYNLDFLTNISKFMKDQRLKIELLVVFGLPEMTHGLDHNFGDHMNQKIRKNRSAQKSRFNTVKSTVGILLPLSRDPRWLTHPNLGS